MATQAEIDAAAERLRVTRNIPGNPWAHHVYTSFNPNAPALQYSSDLITVADAYVSYPPPADHLTVFEFSRLEEWFSDTNRKPAALSFTAGACRDAATAFEQAQRFSQFRVPPQ